MENFFLHLRHNCVTYLGIHHSTSARVLSPCSWASFTNQASSCLSPLWKKGNIVPTAIKIQLWPQHSRISAYFDNRPNGTAKSFSCFTWWIFLFLQQTNQASWEAALGMQGYTRFMDTILCPPRCPLSRSHHGCRRDIAPISTIHKHPSSYLLIHWAWDFLSIRDRAAVCWGSFPTTTVPGTAGPPTGTPPMSSGHMPGYRPTLALGQLATYANHVIWPTHYHLKWMQCVNTTMAWLSCATILYTQISSAQWQTFTPTNIMTTTQSGTSSTPPPTCHRQWAGPQ